ncbi:unnamed protein product [Cylicocyclus nassatus]|uniref:Uncharacterized protein n=1 Tax=Cylicocyclus nassatus TaxID=53992 RepID=A0AA36H595_CYLNA|nr:unnamed protein product [Cylicocyclus nassatus]
MDYAFRIVNRRDAEPHIPFGNSYIHRKQYRLTDVMEKAQKVFDTLTAGAQAFANFEPNFEEERNRWD